MRWIGFRVTRARRGGNAGGQAAARAEISAATASIAGAAGPVLGTENPYFIGFLALARRLLILLPSM
jgi:hypothetical protein